MAYNEKFMKKAIALAKKAEELDVYSFYDDFLAKLNRKIKFTW